LFKESGANREEVDRALVIVDKIKQLFAIQDLKSCNGFHLKLTAGPNKGKSFKIDGSRMLFGSGTKA